ncbi:MAG: S41 family peptidase [Proteobacteria bacterium]|nr:S41 family peptidase [Pseudomonadota bacterium]
MKFKPSLGLGLMLGIALSLPVSLMHTVWADKEQAASLPLDELRTFTDVYARIKKEYVTEVEDSELLKNAIRGMLSGLDSHSSFLDAEQFHDLQIGTTGEFGGLGIEVGMENGFIKVIAPIDDTPAQQAGVQAGDLIIKLDGESVKGLDLQEAVRRMRGKIGSTIELTIVREGEDMPLQMAITRAMIRVHSVRSRMLEPGFGYVRISNFQSKTTSALHEAIESLETENKGELKGLVLDLRNNPGGLLTGAVGVSDVFLQDNALIVYIKGRAGDSELKYSASTNDLLDGAPLVVLINQGSASASEIVAGAMQDHDRATVLGVTSFGKGSVQTILPLKDNTALKLTTARYYTPSGRSIQDAGIVPDILLKSAKDSEDKETDDHGVGDTAKELLQDDAGEAPVPSHDPASVVILPERGEDDSTDYELDEALKHLKAMAQPPAAGHAAGLTPGDQLSKVDEQDIQ